MEHPARSEPRSSRRPIPGLVLSAIAFVVFAGSSAQGVEGPRIRFESGAHDFGQMRSTDPPGTHAWVYHNDGDAPLRIVQTIPQCGCTATVLGEDVPPGASGTLEVSFDPAGMQGSVRKSLAVLSNDPENGRVLLSIVAEVEHVEAELAEGEHPPIRGRSLLAADCASCHAEPAAGKSGAELYDAICAMCHGPEGAGGLAPTFRDADYLSSHSDEDLAVAVAYGTANPKMPGFLDLMGGPLSADQVDSLVRLIRAWGPIDGADSPMNADR